MSLLRSLILAALFVAPIQAESRLSGHITQNSSGDPLPGANVVVVGTRIGAIADARGHFKLQGIESYPVLIRASMVGFKAVELRVESEKDLLIGLEQTTLRGEDVVVTATRTERHRRDVPVIVNIVDERIFEDTQSETLAVGIAFQPALRVENNCQNCGFTQLRINGLEGGYSQILIDGRPIFSALDGVYGLEQIPASMV